MNRIFGFATFAAVVLATVWLFNHFTEGGVAQFGKKALGSGTP